MERDIGTVAAVKALGYSRNDCVKQCSCDELPCPLLTWLVSELWVNYPETENQRRIGVVLVGELRSLLKELHCPYTALTTDTITPALLNVVTEFLVSELQAAHIERQRERHPEESLRGCGDAVREQRAKEECVFETTPWIHEDGDRDGLAEETEEEVRLLLRALDVDAGAQLRDACSQVESRLALLPNGVLPGPLLEASLSSDQWMQLQRLNKLLAQEYQCRQEMMIKRFQVTLQSFAWGENKQERSKLLSSLPALCPPSLQPRDYLSLLLAARKDQSFILPIRPGPKTAIYKVLMGSVPDRGGRPGEIEAPMPVWERRREGGGRGGRGGGRGRREYSGKKKTNKKN